MSKLTDKIEAEIKYFDSIDRSTLRLRTILADVRELERTVENQRAALAVREGELSAEISHSKRATQGLNTVAAASESAIRAAKREAYEHMLSLVGNASHAAKAIHAAIDALDTEGNSDE